MVIWVAETYEDDERHPSGILLFMTQHDVLNRHLPQSDVKGSFYVGTAIGFPVRAVQDLSSRVRHVSILGAFQGPLRSLAWLTSFPQLAQVLVHHPNWVPQGAGRGTPEGGDPQERSGVGFEGRLLEVEALLGPFLHISVLPDHLLGNGLPDVR